MKSRENRHATPSEITKAALVLMASFLLSGTSRSQDQTAIIDRQIDAARSLIAGKSYEDALTLLRSINTRQGLTFEQQTDSVLLTGNCCLRLNKLEDALKHYDTGIKLFEKKLSSNKAAQSNGSVSPKELRRVKSQVHYASARIEAQLGKYITAKKSFEQAIIDDRFNAATHNSYAWMLATCPDPAIHDSELAIYHSATACALTEYSKPNYLDSLAAAYARSGRFRLAANWQDQVIGHPEFRNTVPETSIKEYVRRLELYRSKQAYSEPEAE